MRPLLGMRWRQLSSALAVGVALQRFAPTAGLGLVADAWFLGSSRNRDQKSLGWASVVLGPQGHPAEFSLVEQPAAPAVMPYTYSPPLVTVAPTVAAAFPMVASLPSPAVANSAQVAAAPPQAVIGALSSPLTAPPAATSAGWAAPIAMVPATAAPVVAAPLTAQGQPMAAAPAATQGQPVVAAPAVIATLAPSTQGPAAVAKEATGSKTNTVTSTTETTTTAEAGKSEAEVGWLHWLLALGPLWWMWDHPITMLIITGIVIPIYGLVSKYWTIIRMALGI